MYNSDDIVSYVKSKIGCGYVWGATGQLCTKTYLDTLWNRFHLSESNVNPWNDGNDGKTYYSRCSKWIGKQVFDCGGLLDHKFGINTTAQGYYTKCSQRGTIATIQKTAGVLVFMYSGSNGFMTHVGIYVGDGLVVEARGADFGVVLTKLSDRAWTHWGLCDLIDYTNSTDERIYDIVLKIGSSGELVKTLQTNLNTLGFNCGTADGVFGANTLTAVKSFQTKHGLTVDGIVGEQTLAAIQSALHPPVVAPLIDYEAVAKAANAQIDALNIQIHELTAYKTDILELARIIDKY